MAMNYSQPLSQADVPKYMSGALVVSTLGVMFFIAEVVQRQVRQTKVYKGLSVQKQAAIVWYFVRFIMELACCIGLTYGIYLYFSTGYMSVYIFLYTRFVGTVLAAVFIGEPFYRHFAGMSDKVGIVMHHGPSLTLFCLCLEYSYSESFHKLLVLYGWFATLECFSTGCFIYKRFYPTNVKFLAKLFTFMAYEESAHTISHTIIVFIFYWVYWDGDWHAWHKMALPVMSAFFACIQWYFDQTYWAIAKNLQKQAAALKD